MSTPSPTPLPKLQKMFAFTMDPNKESDEESSQCIEPENS